MSFDDHLLQLTLEDWDVACDHGGNLRARAQEIRMALLQKACLCWWADLNCSHEISP